MVIQRRSAACGHRKDHIGTLTDNQVLRRVYDLRRKQHRQQGRWRAGGYGRIANYNRVVACIARLHIVDRQGGTGSARQRRTVKQPLVIQRRSAGGHHGKCNVAPHDHTLIGRTHCNLRRHEKRERRNGTVCRTHQIGDHNLIVAPIGGCGLAYGERRTARTADVAPVVQIRPVHLPLVKERCRARSQNTENRLCPIGHGQALRLGDDDRRQAHLQRGTVARHPVEIVDHNRIQTTVIGRSANQGQVR